MGEPKRRHDTPGWNRVRNAWTKITAQRSNATNIPLSAGAAFTAQTALQIAQKNFANAQSVELGKTDIPTSVSFPDGKVHSGMDKL